MNVQSVIIVLQVLKHHAQQVSITHKQVQQLLQIVLNEIKENIVRMLLEQKLIVLKDSFVLKAQVVCQMLQHDLPVVIVLQVASKEHYASQENIRTYKTKHHANHVELDIFVMELA